MVATSPEKNNAGLWIILGVVLFIVIVAVCAYAGVCGFYLNSWYCASSPLTVSEWSSIDTRLVTEVNDDEAWQARIYQAIVGSSSIPANAPSLENYQTLTPGLANAICVSACPILNNRTYCNCSAKPPVAESFYL